MEKPANLRITTRDCVLKYIMYNHFIYIRIHNYPQYDTNKQQNSKVHILHEGTSTLLVAQGIVKVSLYLLQQMHML